MPLRMLNTGSDKRRHSPYNILKSVELCKSLYAVFMVSH